MTLISTTNMSVRLGGHVALRNVDFTISAGEIVTVVGPNGSGKSTLLKALIGAVKPTAGKIEKQSNLRVGYVPQKLHIDPTLPLTVRRFLSLPKRKSDEDIDAALAALGERRENVR